MAALEARRQGMSHIVTIDADGQHDPANLPLFLEAVAADPLTVIVGARDFNTENVPGSSRFELYIFCLTGKSCYLFLFLFIDIISFTLDTGMEVR